MCLNLKKALIIFAKRPVPGQVKTRLIPRLSPEEAAELYRCMLGDILTKTADFAGLDSYLFYEGGADAGSYFEKTARGMPCLPQRGNDLGERMAEAFRHVFAEGYGAAAVIGTDSPDLPPSFIERAFEKLEEQHVEAVFGPSVDGGYYLLAMKRLHEGLFRDIPWSSGEVLDRSMENAAIEGIGVALLPRWHDVDRAEDLMRPELAAENSGAPLTREFIKTRIGDRRPETGE